MALYNTPAFIDLVERLRYKAAEVHTYRQSVMAGKADVGGLRARRRDLRTAESMLVEHIESGLHLSRLESEGPTVEEQEHLIDLEPVWPAESDDELTPVEIPAPRKGATP